MKIIKKIIPFLIITIFVLLGILIFIMDKKLTSKLNTLSDITINLDEEYELSQPLTINFQDKTFNLTNHIISTTNYQEGGVGTYKITYKFKYSLYTKTIYRNLIVKDVIPPTITLKEQTTTVEQNTPYKEIDYEVKDNHDTNLTVKVDKKNLNLSKIGTYKVVYTVCDSSENCSTAERTIKVTKAKVNIPEIKYVNTKTTDKNIQNYIKELNEYLSKYNVSVGYVNLNNNFTYLYNKDKSYQEASLIKILMAMYLYDNMDDRTPEIEEKIKLAISKSHNESYESLFDLVGRKKLQSYAVSIGAKKPLTCDGKYCLTNVNQELVYLKHLYSMIKGNKTLKSYFINDYHNPLSFDKSYTNLHKYGNTGNYFHDVGIFLGNEPYLIVVLTEEKANGEASAEKLISEISKKINKLNSLTNK